MNSVKLQKILNVAKIISRLKTLFLSKVIFHENVYLQTKLLETY